MSDSPYRAKGFADLTPAERSRILNTTRREMAGEAHKKTFVTQDLANAVLQVLGWVPCLLEDQGREWRITRRGNDICITAAEGFVPTSRLSLDTLRRIADGRD